MLIAIMLTDFGVRRASLRPTPGAEQVGFVTKRLCLMAKRRDETPKHIRLGMEPIAARTNQIGFDTKSVWFETSLFGF
jgi:hypothetical protein